MQQILVTGGNGFIGSHLVDALAAAGNRVVILDLFPRLHGDLPDGVLFIQGNLQALHTIRHILQDNQIEVVYHTAWANIHETAIKDPLGDIQTNVAASINLLNACQDTGVKRVVYLSSGGTVYGVPQSYPIKESHPTNPINAYGVTKLIVEKYLHMYYHLYGLEYVILRPSVPYGPRQNPNRHQGVVSVFINRALHDQSVSIFGDGEVIRDYFYIDDLTQALLAAKEIPFNPQNAIFNLGGMHPYSLNELVRKIEAVLGVKLEVKYEPARKFDAPKLLLDIQLAQSQLNWSPTVSLDEGIKRTAQWLEQWEQKS